MCVCVCVFVFVCVRVRVGVCVCVYAYIYYTMFTLIGADDSVYSLQTTLYMNTDSVRV